MNRRFAASCGAACWARGTTVALRPFAMAAVEPVQLRVECDTQLRCHKGSRAVFSSGQFATFLIAPCTAAAGVKLRYAEPNAREASQPSFLASRVQSQFAGGQNYNARGRDYNEVRDSCAVARYDDLQLSKNCTRRNGSCSRLGIDSRRWCTNWTRQISVCCGSVRSGRSRRCCASFGNWVGGDRRSCSSLPATCGSLT